MSDFAAILLAVSAAAGALFARPFPVLLAAGVIAAALALRHPVLLCVGVAVAASGLAARSWAGLEPPEPRSVAATMTLVSDPTEVAGALRVDVRHEGKRIEAWARGRSAGRLRRALAGERVHLTGHLSPMPADQRERVAPRHVGARLTVETVGASSPGDLPSRVANRIRRALLRGAESLPQERRSLFAGFVLGDDRGQPPEVAFDFRASGLSHLLVVSGQNVAFVLAVAGPLLRRFSLRGRLAVGVVVLVFFGTLTRWEPSVLRAVAMAGLALLAGSLGRPASGLRMLALAVSGLLLIDPLLVHSIGFRLSVGACAGIALWSRPLTAALPGPRPVAEALGVTVAAQAGVAPVLIPVFGGLPVVSLLANLLALPAAGPLMIWGLAAGLPAGLLGGTVADAVHVPTRLLLAWVAGVARETARLPFGQLGLGHLAVLVAAGLAVVLAVRRDRRRVAHLAIAAAVVVLMAPAVAALRPSTVVARSVARGATLWRSGAASVVVLDGVRSDGDRLLSGLQNAGVRGLDLLVVSRPGSADARAAEVVRRRFAARLVVAPPKALVLGAQVPPPGAIVDLGGLSVSFEHADGRLVATVATATRAAARGPPGSVAPMRLTLGARALDLATRSLVVGVVDGRAPGSTDRAKALAAEGADVVEVVLGDDPVAAGRQVEALVAALVPAAVAVAAPCPDVAVAAYAAGAVLGGAHTAGALEAAAQAGASVIVRASGTDVRGQLAERAHEAEKAGLPPARIVVDPVLDVPTLYDVRRVAELGYPVLVTISDDDRDRALAATAVAIVGGCRLVRTRDVRGARRVADVLAAVLEARS